MTALRFLGRLSLDLTVTGGEGPYGRIETLPGAPDLARWLADLAVINAVAARPPLVPNVTDPAPARVWREASPDCALIFRP